MDFQAARLRLASRIRILFSQTQIIIPGFQHLTSSDEGLVDDILGRTFLPYEAWLVRKGTATITSRETYEREKIEKRVEIKFDLEEAANKNEANPEINSIVQNTIADIYSKDPQSFYGVKRLLVGFGGSDFEARGAYYSKNRTVYIDIDQFVTGTEINIIALRKVIVHELRHAKTHRASKRHLEALKKPEFDINEFNSNPIIKRWGHDIETFADLFDEYCSEFAALEYLVENHTIGEVAEAFKDNYINELMDSLDGLFNDHPHLAENKFVQTIRDLREKLGTLINGDLTKVFQRLQEIKSWGDDLKGESLREFVEGELGPYEDQFGTHAATPNKEIQQLLMEIKILMGE